MLNVKQKAMIVIPARLASTRLPNKPLLSINGLPMIVHVINRAQEALKHIEAAILVASADKEIIECVNNYFNKAGTKSIHCVLTNPNLPSGTDRIKAALDSLDSSKQFEYIINLQGDLPTISGNDIKACLQDTISSNFDITTLVANINTAEDYHNPNIVKAVLANSAHSNNNLHKVLYFSRSAIPYNAIEEKVAYHHIGIYGYKRSALETFTALPVSLLEKIEKLEQLRALENNLTIAARIVNSIPIGVDTKEDLLKAEQYLINNAKGLF